MKDNRHALSGEKFGLSDSDDPEQRIINVCGSDDGIHNKIPSGHFFWDVQAE